MPLWEDNYRWGLGLPHNQCWIGVLVRAHEQFAGGSSAVLYADHDL